MLTIKRFTLKLRQVYKKNRKSLNDVCLSRKF